MGRQLRSGFLVAIEGIDGAGKTTQVRLLAQRMTEKGFEVVASKEPTNGIWGQVLRRSATEGRLPAEEELEMFIRDRREHVETLIRPALNRQAVVIVDRYYFSNIAYQSLRGGDVATIRTRNEEFAPVPDLLVVLDLDPALSVERIEAREGGGGRNHFEHVHLLEQSRAVFLRCVREYPKENKEGHLVWAFALDATQPPEEIADKIEATAKRVMVEQISAEKLAPEDAMKATLGVFGFPS